MLVAGAFAANPSGPIGPGYVGWVEGHGELVRRGRADGRYADDLIDAAASVITTHFRSANERPAYIVPVPSLRRPALVADLAARLSASLGWPVLDALEHIRLHPPQADMRNSHQQAANLIGAFRVAARLDDEPILLLDDVADSKWTLTVLGDLLQGHGSGSVYPFVLAVTNVSTGE